MYGHHFIIVIGCNYSTGTSKAALYEKLRRIPMNRTTIQPGQLRVVGIVKASWFHTIKAISFFIHFIHRVPSAEWPSLYFTLVSLLMLAGCAHSPSISEVQLVSNNHAIYVRDLYCPASGDIVAIGQIPLYSKDRGTTWQKATIEPEPTYLALSLVRIPSMDGTSALYVSSYRNGLLSAEPGPWWISQDGGRTWGPTGPQLAIGKPKLVFDFFPKIVIADTTGTLVTTVVESKGVFLLRSTDWGEHWDKQLLQMPRDFASPIVSDGHGHLAFYGRSLPRPRHPFDFDGYIDINMVYWSSDAGATWNDSIAPDRWGSRGWFWSDMRLYRSPSGKMVAFSSSYLYGSDNGIGILPSTGGYTGFLHSVDNGQTWKDSSRVGEFGKIKSITGDERGRIVAVTESGIILLSDDGGATWRNVGKPTMKSRSGNFAKKPSPIIFAGKEIVIATIGNKIIRSSDRGDTWTTVDSRLPDRDYGFSALCEDGNGLIIAAGDGMLTRSLDWGLTWQPGKME